MSATQAQDGTPLKRIAFASMVGTVIEWYDFFLFVLCSSIVFPHIFFPQGDSASATIESFAVFGVAYVARPVGAAVFGHYGDKLGRKTSLTATLVLMGGATLGIAVLPTYDSLGLAAPVILTVLRLCQGFGLGGEWGGAALLAVEHAPPGKRGLYGLFPQLGNPIGFFLSNAVLQLTLLVVGRDGFERGGWRVAFLIGGAFIFIGLYVRLRIMDSQVFIASKARGKGHGSFPLGALLRNHWKVLVLSIVMQAPFAVGSYGLNSYFGTYVTDTLGKPASWVLMAGMVGSLLSIPTYIAFSMLSDKIGRKPVYAIGGFGWLILALPFYWLISTGSLIGVIVAVALGWSICHAASFAVQSSYLAELFPTEVRYSGASMSYQMSSVLFGAPAGAIAAALYANTGSIYSVSIYVIVGCAVGLIALTQVRETFRTSLDHPSEPAQASATSRAASHAPLDAG
ncbi:MFS transporter [Streptomyces melanosporofaciens]|uniref:Predicted arabinose efflux permease, MFS family n=1 Tax=Streptomyces melanosporofaciens TaxID=67327 RepID=A0A1H4KHT6_STRMJ|nr:Predicted arabinose efflux permease, MFS family [Streptomyces melanosporofaciens]